MPRRQEPDRRCPFPGPDHQHPLPALGPVWTPIGKPCRDVTLAVCVCPHTRGPAFASLWISTCEPFSELLSVRSCSGAVPWRSVIRPRRGASRALSRACTVRAATSRCALKDDLELRRAKACHLKPGDRIAVWLPGQAAPQAPKWRDLRGDPGPPAAAVPPPAGYPVGPGMGPIGAGSPNAGPGSPVGADGAR